MDNEIAKQLAAIEAAFTSDNDAAARAALIALAGGALTDLRRVSTALETIAARMPALALSR